MNINLLIVLNKEYTIQLTNILSPLIYEGLQSIYQESVKSSTNEALILKNFQIILRTIKDWDENRIKKELIRINTKTLTTYPWFIKLIQAVFKTSQLILDIDVSYDLIQDVNVGSFIHHVYIECARIFWMDPFLFYHIYSAYEINCNLNIIMSKISLSVDNAIRRLLPMGIILDKFIDEKSINIKNIPINELYNMPLLLEKVTFNNIIDTKKDYTFDMVNLDDLEGGLIKEPVIEKQEGGANNKLTDLQVNNKILEILNNKDLKLSETLDTSKPFLESKNFVESKPLESKNITKPDLKKQESKKSDSRESERSTSMRKNENDSKTKLEILKNLDSETYKPEDNNEKYQDIFSNSEINKNGANKKIPQAKKTEKFFNNYLNI
jgi:hypothetical protein